MSGPKPKRKGELVVKVYQGENAMSVDDAMELIGWTVVEKGGVLRDKDGNWVKLENNATNRPWRPGISKRYMLEILRGKWALNGEPIIFDWDGKCQSGQHRLIAFILAVEEWKKDKKKWGKYWKKEPTLEILVVRGISPAPEVVNTIDQGQKRTLGDIIYRSELFSSEGLSLGEGKDNTIKLPEMGPKGHAFLARILAHAARLTWLRATDRNVSDAPHFPPSEAMDFIDAHPGLLYAVAFISLLEVGEEKEGQRVSRFISLGYASGLFYIMATSGTDPDEFIEKGEAALDYSMLPQAKEFWEKLASGLDLKAGDPVYVMREMLPKINAGSAIGRDEVVATVIKAFNLFVEGKKIKPQQLVIRKQSDENGVEKLVDMPRLGGIDTEGPEKPLTPEEIDDQEMTDDREGERQTKGRWQEGDTCWVKDADGDHWFGTVLEYHKAEKGAGQDTVTLEDDKGKQWVENIGRLSIKYPG